MTTVTIIKRVNKGRLTYKSLTQIRQLQAMQLSKGAGFGGVYAYTDPHFSFGHYPLKDWKLTRQAPREWTFVGMSLTLQVSPEVVLPSEYRKLHLVMKPIAEHEELHVKDARDIVQMKLPSALKKDATFRKYFIDRKPIPDSTYHHMIRKQMAGYVTAMFAQFWHASFACRDTPKKYKAVQKAVEAGLRYHSNR
jgi:hypothetical protein